MTNFTTNYLGILQQLGRIGVCSDGDIPISTIKYGEKNVPIIYRRPRLIYDKYSAKDEIVKPDIVIIKDSMQMLEEINVNILSIPVSNPWFKKQSVEYKMQKKGGLLPGGTSILNQFPKYHYAEYDRANQRVKLIGQNCKNHQTGMINSTEWVSLK